MDGNAFCVVSDQVAEKTNPAQTGTRFQVRGFKCFLCCHFPLVLQSGACGLPPFTLDFRQKLSLKYELSIMVM